MNLDQVEASLRQRVAEFIAVPGRLRSVRSQLSALSRASGATAPFLEAVTTLQGAVRMVEQQQAAADAKLQPLLMQLQAASGTVEKIGAGVSLAALAPVVVGVLSETQRVEGQTGVLRDQAAQAGFQVPATTNPAAWVAVAVGVALVALWRVR